MQYNEMGMKLCFCDGLSLVYPASFLRISTDSGEGPRILSTARLRNEYLTKSEKRSPILYKYVQDLSPI